MAKADRDGEHGFTLVEMLIVIVIVGVLAGIAIPIFLSDRARADDGKARSDLRNLAVAEESYAADNSSVYAGASQMVEAESQPSISADDSIYFFTRDTDGYCLIGHSGGSTAYFVFDSMGGGLQHDAQPSLTDAQNRCTGSGYAAAGSLVSDGNALTVG